MSFFLSIPGAHLSSAQLLLVGSLLRGPGDGRAAADASAPVDPRPTGDQPAVETDPA